MPIVVGLLAAFTLISGALYAAGHVFARVMLRRAARKAVCGPLAARPPISVLKPLAGDEPGLEENLESFACQRGAELEIVLGAARADDPALIVARRFADNHPELPVTILAGLPRLGPNPKVSSLAALARAARHELLLVSDSNVRVRPDYLSDLSSRISAPGVGLVVSAVTGAGGRALGGVFDALHLDTFVYLAVASVWVATGRAIGIGKSMLIRRRDLHRLGGFESLLGYLAEDWALVEKVRRLGLRVELAPRPVEVVTEGRTLREFVARHVRWGQMRRHIAPSSWFIAEPLLQPTIWAGALIAASVFATEAYPRTLVLVTAGALVIAGKVLLDLSLARRVRPRIELTRAPALAVIAKDLLIAWVWLRATLSDRVEWRGNHLRVGRASRLIGASRPPRWTDRLEEEAA